MFFDKARAGSVCVLDELRCCIVLTVLGDWHCAYVLLYGPRVLEVTDDVPMETEQQMSTTEISS